MKATIFTLFILFSGSESMIPPKFQWKTIDFDWERNSEKRTAMASGDYIPTHNMPTGLARWKDKLFITVPRWKRGVPSSLNYVTIQENDSQSQSLKPYPSWRDAYVRDSNPRLISNSTVVSTFRIHVDTCDRLWVVDNGVTDMAGAAKQVTQPSVLIFDLTKDSLLHRFLLPTDVVKNDSVFTSIVVDIDGQNCNNAFAYITDMGSNALVIFRLKAEDAWRIEHPHFKFDPSAGVYRVGGIDFNWNDGVSSAALSAPDKDGHRDLFLQPTSSTKQFKISTKLLKTKDTTKDDLKNGVELVGDRGSKSQSTACDYDPKTNVLFYTLVSKNGFGCWNLEMPYTKDNTPLIVSDCGLLEFPNDIKVDEDGNLWILSNRQSKFLYEKMDFNQINFRILTDPVSKIIQGTPCEKNKDSSLQKNKSIKKI